MYRHSIGLYTGINGEGNGNYCLGFRVRMEEGNILHKGYIGGILFPYSVVPTSRLNVDA